MKKQILSAAVSVVVAGLMVDAARGQSMWQPTTTPNTWNLDTNWSPVGVPNGVGATALVTADLPAASTINLDTSVTLGSLVVGDPTTAFFGYTIAPGTGGALTFAQTGTTTATLAKVTAPTNNATDNITAPITLASNLSVSNVTTSGSTLRLSGTISGPGNLIRTNLRSDGTTASGTTSGLVVIGSTNNSYGGITAVTDGILQFTGSVLSGQNSALGNATTPIYVSTSATSFAGSTASQGIGTTTELRMIATDDTSSYTISRGLDFSAATAPTSGNPSTIVFRFNGDGVGGVNTNKLTISGPITFSSITGNNRNVQFLAAKAGMTVDFTGLITGGLSTVNLTMIIGENPAAANVDGSNANATYRFSNQSNTFAGGLGANSGTIIVAGNIGATGTPSPIGLGLANGRVINWSLGTGGNIANGVAGSAAGQVKSFLMETGGTSVSRVFFLAAGGNTTLTAQYGGIVSSINGWILGQPASATNLDQSVTFAGTVTNAANNIGTSNDPASTITNKILIANNLALIAANGGTINFTGGINEAAGVISSNGATGTSGSTRVTINQFRNHPNLDVNQDGVPDNGLTTGNNANEWIGSPTNGTVKFNTGNVTLTGTLQLRGGTLVVNNTSNVTDSVIIDAGTTLGGFGTFGVGGAASILDVSGTINPGDPAVPATAGNLRVNKPITFRPGSSLTIDINGTAATPLVDVITVGAAATVTLDPTTALNVNLAFDPNLGQGFKFIDLNNPATAVGALGTPGFAGLPQNSIIGKAIAGVPVSLQLFYNAGANPNADVSLNAVSPINAWAAPGSGSWTNTASWTNPAGVAYFPQSNKMTAFFGNTVTGATTVSLDTPITVAALRFAGVGTNSYTISGTGSITLTTTTGSAVATVPGGPAGSASIDAQAGTHTIAVPVVIGTNTYVSISNGAFLRATGGISIPAGQTMTVNPRGSADLGVISGAGNLSVTFGLATGTLSATRLSVGSLSVAGGATVRLAAGGEASSVGALTLTGTSVLDLRDNGLVVAAGNVAALRAAVSSWYSGGLRTGTGLTSSVAAVGGSASATTLAVFPNDAGGVPFYELYDGIALAATDVIVRYTYVGDTDIDGDVDGTDYVNLIEGLTRGLTGWEHGDLDYNGVINADDVTLFNSVLAQGLPSLGGISGGGDGGSGAVPEPGPTAAFAGLAAAGLLSRRRRTA